MARSPRAAGRCGSHAADGRSPGSRSAPDTPRPPRPRRWQPFRRRASPPTAAHRTSGSAIAAHDVLQAFQPRLMGPGHADPCGDPRFQVRGLTLLGVAAGRRGWSLCWLSDQMVVLESAAEAVGRCPRTRRRRPRQDRSRRKSPTTGIGGACEGGAGVGVGFWPAASPAHLDPLNAPKAKRHRPDAIATSTTTAGIVILDADLAGTACALACAAPTPARPTWWRRIPASRCGAPGRGQSPRTGRTAAGSSPAPCRKPAPDWIIRAGGHRWVAGSRSGAH